MARVSSRDRASDSFVILLHFLIYSLGWNGAKLQEQRVASVAECLACLQYDPWSMGSNPTSADFVLLFITSIFGQCSRHLTTYMHYVHDIWYFCTKRTEQKWASTSFSVLLCIIYTVCLCEYGINLWILAMHIYVIMGDQLDEQLFFWQPTFSIILYVIALYLVWFLWWK